MDFEFVLRLCALIPAVLVGVSVYLWREARPSTCWRHWALAIGIATASVSLSALYVVMIHEAKIGNLRWSTFKVIYDIATSLSMFAILAALVGKGKGRVLVGASALITLVIWSLEHGPDFFR